MAEPVTEGAGPLSAPSSMVSRILWPTETLFQNIGNILQLERSIGGAIPTEYTEDRDFGGVGVPMKMSEGDLAIVVFTKGRNKNQIGGVPALAVARVGRSAFLDNEGVEDAAQNNDGETSPAELDEKNTEGLAAACQGTKLADRAICEFLRFIFSETEVVSVVLEGKIIETIIFDGPVKLFAKPFKEVVESGDGVKGVRHSTNPSKSVQLISIQHLRTGATPTGACKGRRWVLVSCFSAFPRSLVRAA